MELVLRNSRCKLLTIYIKEDRVSHFHAKYVKNSNITMKGNKFISFKKLKVAQKIRISTEYINNEKSQIIDFEL